MAKKKTSKAKKKTAKKKVAAGSKPRKSKPKKPRAARKAPKTARSPGLALTGKALTTALAAPKPARVQLRPQDLATLANLNKIDHVVVLMLENRSFDHLLGWLSLSPSSRADVDGLQAGMTNPDKAGAPVPITHLKTTAVDPDPCHGGKCVDAQLSHGCQGFVKNFQDTHPKEDPRIAMGYYEAQDVPTYKFLAEEFTICQRRFASIAGQTWPNRLYALSGVTAGSRENAVPPVYSNRSFARHLDAAKVLWRWYVHDFNSLRLVDDQYRTNTKADMRWFKRFAVDVAAGDLPAVTWIDPNYTIVSAKNANDDHPPADIRDGQRLVADVYSALSANAALWAKTLLIVTYDEHGGFFDHVMPPAQAPATDYPHYGCRVPAFVVSPFAQRGLAAPPAPISSPPPPLYLYDHTSIIKSILARFCRDAADTVPNMGPRVREANHLGNLLTEAVARPAPQLPPAPAAMAAGRARVAADLHLAAPRVVERTELQKGLLQADADGLLPVKP